MRPACRRQGKLHVRFDEGGVARNAWHAASEPQRGNPVTDVCRSLNIVTYSSTLLLFVVKLPSTSVRSLPFDPFSAYRLQTTRTFFFFMLS